MRITTQSRPETSRYVVRMALDLRRDLEQLLVLVRVELLAGDRQAGQDAGHDGRGAGPEPASVRDALPQLVPLASAMHIRQPVIAARSQFQN